MVMQLTNQLEKTFGSLSKTLFFEYQTIQELSGYFLENYHEQLNQLMGIAAKAAQGLNESDWIGAGKPERWVDRRKRSVSPGLIPRRRRIKRSRPLDIAIIGVSGRYPQARNI